MTATAVEIPNSAQWKAMSCFVAASWEAEAPSMHSDTMTAAIAAISRPLSLLPSSALPSNAVTMRFPATMVCARKRGSSRAAMAPPPKPRTTITVPIRNVGSRKVSTVDFREGPPSVVIAAASEGAAAFRAPIARNTVDKP